MQHVVLRAVVGHLHEGRALQRRRLLETVSVPMTPLPPGETVEPAAAEQARHVAAAGQRLAAAQGQRGVAAPTRQIPAGIDDEWTPEIERCPPASESAALMMMLEPPETVPLFASDSVPPVLMVMLVLRRNGAVVDHRHRARGDERVARVGVVGRQIQRLRPRS